MIERDAIPELQDADRQPYGRPGLLDCMADDAEWRRYMAGLLDQADPRNPWRPTRGEEPA